MNNLALNKKAPNFSLKDELGVTHKLSDYKDKYVLLYFYPKDSTPGCTTEALMFKKALTQLKKLGVEVLGVSADSVESHSKFKKKFKLNFPLLSDVEKKTVTDYGVWGPKKFMGRTFDGISRTSFLISPDGKIIKIYEGVKPLIHASEVLKDVKELKKNK